MLNGTDIRSVPHFNPISVPFRILIPYPFRSVTHFNPIRSVPFRILTSSVPFRIRSVPHPFRFRILT
jgi:hypothetical protein